MFHESSEYGRKLVFWVENDRKWHVKTHKTLKSYFYFRVCSALFLCPHRDGLSCPLVLILSNLKLWKHFRKDAISCELGEYRSSVQQSMDQSPLILLLHSLFFFPSPSFFPLHLCTNILTLINFNKHLFQTNQKFNTYKQMVLHLTLKDCIYLDYYNKLN